MKFAILTKGLSFQLVLKFNYLVPGSLFIRGYDADKSNTTYFFRTVPMPSQGTDEINFNLPVSPPRELTLDIKAANGLPDNQAYRLDGIYTRSLFRKNLILSPNEQEFISFAQWFSQNCGSFSSGNYRDRENKFLIQYLDKITEGGKIIPTPARVDHYSGTIQITRPMFRNYTIPMRMFILMHERFHYTMDSFQESEADINALNVCLALGYPKLELLYAATKVFDDTPANRVRVDLMMKYIENYA